MASIKNSTDAEVRQAVATARKTFASGVTRDVAWRKKQIQGIKRMVTENFDALRTALNKDLGVNEWWTDCIELHMVLQEVNCTLGSMDDWLKPITQSTPILAKPGTSKLIPEPFGVILIIGPWNYPFSLILQPLISALAAGNTAVIKPSEVSVNSSLLLAELCPKYVDASAVTFVQGDKDPTSVLLKEKFDLIFYTGNGVVARIVYEAAAKYLTPVILELGGKCPCIVTSSADAVAASQRIAWGKFSMNMGQTCLSPDYILTTPDKEAELVSCLKATLEKFFGPDPKSNSDVSRIVNERHANRVAALLDDSTITVLHGGDKDIKAKYVSPTIVRATAQSKCMQDEIFGPILAIVVVDSLEEAIKFVNSREKALALYIFSKSKQEQELVISSTSSGGVSVNDTIMHAASSCLPFGGVGESGIGAYRGEFGFRACSHLKPVYSKLGSDVDLRFAPYTQSKVKWFKRINHLSINLPKTSTVVLTLLGVVALVASVIVATK